MRQFRTRLLSAERIAQAFPLVQASLPEVTLEAWCAFAAALMAGGGPEGGILAVTDERDYIAGLCAYRQVPDPVCGHLLDAGHFLAFDLFDRRAVADALAQGIEALAGTHGCRAVHTRLTYKGHPPPDPGNGLVDLLTARGHRVESLGLRKRLKT